MPFMNETTIETGGLGACCRETVRSLPTDRRVVDGSMLLCPCGTPVVLRDGVWRWDRDFELAA